MKGVVEGVIGDTGYIYGVVGGQGQGNVGGHEKGVS